VTAGAEAAHELWRRVISDELIYEAMLGGHHRERAEALRLSEDELRALDELRAQPGTIWAVENIRFRGTSMTLRTLRGRLPCTVQLLTQGNADWLWDLAYEYLAWCRWQDLGHARAAEALRFVDFVRRRVMARRRFPAFMDTVLGYEAAANVLLQRCAGLPVDRWPRDGDALAGRIAGARLRLSDTATLVALTHDLVDWLRGPSAGVSWFEAASGPVPAEVAAAPAFVVLHLASAEARVAAERLEPDQHAVLASCRGEATGRELLAARADLPGAAAWLGAWARRGIVVDTEAPR